MPTMIHALITIFTVSSASAQFYTCSNGCRVNGTVGNALIVFTDDGTYCEVMCCPGSMQTETGVHTFNDNSHNLAVCATPGAWCIAGNDCNQEDPYEIKCSGSSVVTPTRVSDSTCPNQYRNNAPVSFPSNCIMTSTKTSTSTHSTKTTTPRSTKTTTPRTTTHTSTKSTTTTPTTTDTTTSSTTADTTTTSTAPDSTSSSSTTDTSTLSTAPYSTTSSTATDTSTSSTTPASTTFSTLTDTTTSSTTADTSTSSGTAYPTTTSTITDTSTSIAFSIITLYATTPTVITSSSTTTPAVTTATHITTPAVTATSRSTSSTVTSTTQTMTSTTTVPEFIPRCTPIILKNGILYDNICVEVDTGAVCSDDLHLPFCTCSPGYTDTYCGVTDGQLSAISPLSGPSQNGASVLHMITSTKASGTAQFMSNMPSLLCFLTDAQRVALSFDATDLIKDATFEGNHLDVSTSFVSFNDPSLGNCFTFNHWNSSFLYMARMIGARGGLVVELDAMPEEYLPFIDTMGVNVYVTEIGSDIYIESNKILSQPSGSDRIMLTRKSTKLLDDWKSDCAHDKTSAQSYYFSGNYSVDGCYRSCYQDSCYASCGCMDPMYQRRDGVDACTFDQLSCIFNMSTNRGDPYKWKECHCPEPCNSDDFQISYSRITLTSKVICQQSGFNNSTDTCKPRGSYVTVAFSSLEALVQVEVERYPLSRALGNIGNVGGLLLGLSVTCICEAFLFLSSCFFIGIDKEQYAPKPGRIE